jgi:lysophospholipase L1-like esterase
MSSEMMLQLYRNLLFVVLITISCSSHSEMETPGLPRIFSFAIVQGGVRYEGVIDEASKRIRVEVPMNVALGELKADVTYSDNCLLTPNIDFQLSFNKEVDFKLIGTDGTEVVYHVGVESNQKMVDLSNNRVLMQGCLYPSIQNNQIQLNRFSDDVIQRMRLSSGYFERTQPCVSIVFSTNSSIVYLELVKNRYKVDWGVDIGIYANGKFLKSVHETSFYLHSPLGKGEYVTWEVVLPVMCSLDFKGLYIEKEADLDEPVKKHSVLVTIGDSMTHGVGTGNASYKTYPFLMAEAMNMDVFNLAIGGSKVSPAVADELKMLEASLITVLWGFNDWCYIGDQQLFREQYEAMLTNIRAIRPNTPLLIINLLETQAESVNTTDNIDVYRNIIEELYWQFKNDGDQNIWLVAPGVVDLMDGIHPSSAGARQLADELVYFINNHMKLN